MKIEFVSYSYPKFDNLKMMYSVAKGTTAAAILAAGAPLPLATLTMMALLPSKKLFTLAYNKIIASNGNNKTTIYSSNSKFTKNIGCKLQLIATFALMSTVYSQENNTPVSDNLPLCNLKHPIPDQVIDINDQYRYTINAEDVFYENGLILGLDEQTKTSPGCQSLRRFPSIDLALFFDLGKYVYLNNVIINGGIAYVAVGQSLNIINISVPGNPVKIENIEFDDTVNAFTVNTDTAYVMVDNKLNIINISSPNHPVKIGNITINYNFDWLVTVSEGIAYFKTYNGRYSTTTLNIINVSNPIEVGNIVIGGYVNDIAVSNGIAYVALREDLAERLDIINISNPNYPVKVGNITISGEATGVTLSKDMAYVAAGLGGVDIIDISHPSYPVKLGNLATTIGRVNDLTVSGDIVYAVGWGGLCIINISTPSAPTKLGSLLTANALTEIKVSEKTVYFLDNNVLYIIDFKSFELQAPMEGTFFNYNTTCDVVLIAAVNNSNCVLKLKLIIDQVPFVVNDIKVQKFFPLQNISLVLHPNDLFNSRSQLQSLIAYNYSDLPKWLNFMMAPFQIGKFSYKNAEINDLIFDNTNIYIASSVGFLIVDITTLSGPFLINSYLNINSTKLVVNAFDKIAYVACSDGFRMFYFGKAPITQLGMYLYKNNKIDYTKDQILLTSSSQIVQLSSKIFRVPTNGSAFWVTVSEGIAYVAGNSGLDIINVSIPDSPIKIGNINNILIEAEARAVTVSKGIAYMAVDCYLYGVLDIINISNSSDPKRVGNISMESSAYGIAVSGDIAYVTSQTGIYIINISIHSHPIKIGNIDDANNGISLSRGRGVVITENIAYVATVSGLKIINISNPNAIVEIGSIRTTSYSEMVTISGDIACVTDAFGSFYIINISISSNPVKMGQIAKSGYSGYLSSVTVSGDIAYVTVGSKGLDIINISAPSEPVKIGNILTSGSAYGVTVSGDTAYIATDTGLNIIQLPITYRAQHLINSIDILNDTVTVIATENNLQVLNTENPHNVYAIAVHPFKLASIIKIIDSLSFVVNNIEMQIFNTSVLITHQATSFIPLSIYQLSSQVNDFTMSNNKLFMATNDGLEIVNITNIAKPILITKYQYDTPAIAIKVKNDRYVFLSTGKSLEILDCYRWQLIGIPGIEDIGNYNFTLITTDELGGQAHLDFSMVIMQPPILTQNIPNQLAFEGKAFDFMIPNDTFKDLNDNNNVISFSISSLIHSVNLPLWLIFDSKGKFSGTPTILDVDFYKDRILPINITAMNGGPLGISAIFNISVRGKITQPPILINYIKNNTAKVGKLFEFTIPDTIFKDANNNSLNYVASLADLNTQSLPAWLQFDSSKIKFFGTPGMEDTDFYKDRILLINITAKNAGPVATSTIFKINVQGMSYGQLAVTTISSVAAGLITLYYGISSLYKNREFFKHHWQNKVKTPKPWVTDKFVGIKETTHGYDQVFICSNKPTVDKIEPKKIYLYLQKNNISITDLTTNNEDISSEEQQLMQYDLKYICHKSDHITVYNEIILCNQKPTLQQMYNKTIYIYLDQDELTYACKRHSFKKSITDVSFVTKTLEEQIAIYTEQEEKIKLPIELTCYSDLRNLLFTQRSQQSKLPDQYKNQIFEFASQYSHVPYDIVTVNQELPIYLDIKRKLMEFNNAEELSIHPLPKEFRKSFFEFSAKKDHIKRTKVIEPYKLVSANKADFAKVLECYERYPVPGYTLRTVDIIYNPGMIRAFDDNLQMLQARYGNPAFRPKFENEKAVASDGSLKRTIMQDGSLGKLVDEAPEYKQWRKDVRKMWEDRARPYIDPSYPNVKLLPLWHGTDPNIIKSIFRTGYANLATTDSGYFGKGLYSTWEAGYSKYYYKGTLILNWVSSLSAYPVIAGDMKKLTGKGNYQNYDTHFVPVISYTAENVDSFVPEILRNVPVSLRNNSENLAKVSDVFLPCAPDQKPMYTEIVVFEKVQCLPRYLVTLQPSLPRSPTRIIVTPIAGVSDSVQLLTNDNEQVASNTNSVIIFSNRGRASSSDSRQMFEDSSEASECTSNTNNYSRPKFGNS